ncbi:MAG: YceI family protein [Actinomycetota bacterium]
MRTRYVIGLIAVVVLAFGGWFIYENLFDTDAPDELTTEAALTQLETDLTGGDVDEPETEAAPVADTSNDPRTVEGVWTVDDEFGDFDFQTASGSFAGFRVAKTLFTGGGVTAVGRTGGVTGEVTITEGALSSASIVVQMAEIVSDESRRESAIQDTVKARDFPTAAFAVTAPVAVDTDALPAGETVAATVTGDLTIAGVTNSEEISIDATIPSDGVGLIIGSAELVWADYGIDAPDSLSGTVADEGILEFQLVVRLG